MLGCPEPETLFIFNILSEFALEMGFVAFILHEI
jgi:hypothetical protein